MLRIPPINLRQMLLIDAFGAIGSALYNGVLLAGFSASLGIERRLLQSLGLVAVIFAMFSFASFFLARVVGDRLPRRLLRVIVAANLIYAAATSILIGFLPQITALGRLALAGELIAIIMVVSLEVRVLSQKGSGS